MSNERLDQILHKEPNYGSRPRNELEQFGIAARRYIGAAEFNQSRETNLQQPINVYGAEINTTSASTSSSELKDLFAGPAATNGESARVGIFEYLQ